MKYELEEIKEMRRNGYTIKYSYYRVLNYNGNEKQLKEFVEKLNDDSMFNIDYYIYSNKNGEVIIEEVYDTLD